MIRANLYCWLLLTLLLVVGVQRSFGQVCANDLSYTTEVVDAVCLADGKITVNVSGDESGISNLLFQLVPVTSGGSSRIPLPDKVITNIKPGTYNIVVTGTCAADGKPYSHTISNIVVGGSYQEIVATLNDEASRGSFSCGTGIIALDVTGGSGTFTFMFTKAPAGVATNVPITPTRSGTRYTLPGETYPPGEYTVTVSDACYTGAANFTIKQLALPVISNTNTQIFTPNLSGTGSGSCNTVTASITSSDITTNADLRKYFNLGLFEIGTAPSSATTAEVWQTWTSNAQLGTELNLGTHTLNEYYTANSLGIFVRLKNCPTIMSKVTANFAEPEIIENVGVGDCDNYTYNFTTYADYRTVLCYPLAVTIKNQATGEVLYNEPSWTLAQNANDQTLLKYGLGTTNITYILTIVDSNGKTITKTIQRNKVVEIVRQENYCDNGIIYHYTVTGANTPACLPITVTITGPNNFRIVQTITSTDPAVTPLLPPGTYNVSASYPNGDKVGRYFISSNVHPKYIDLRLDNAGRNACTFHRGRLRVVPNDSGKRLQPGSVITITGPEGYTSQTLTVTNPNGTFAEVFPEAYIPPGKYKVTLVSDCGVEQEFDWQGVYATEGFTYSAVRTCEGLVVTPSGYITMQGQTVESETQYRLIAGPRGFSTVPINVGGSLTLKTAGTYTLAIFKKGVNQLNCNLGTTTIVYNPEALTLDASATTAYTCSDQLAIQGHIFAKAKGGVAPYSYALYDATNTTPISVVGQPTSDGGIHFAYGQTGTSYVVRVTDACGTSFPQTVTINNFADVNIITTPNIRTCKGESITFSCLSVGDVVYSWTGPNGFTSSTRVNTLTNVQPNMSGTYTVTVKPEGCTTTISANIQIYVSPCYTYVNPHLLSPVSK